MLQKYLQQWKLKKVITLKNKHLKMANIIQYIKIIKQLILAIIIKTQKII